MIVIEAATADELWCQAAEYIRSTGSIQSGRDQPTRELMHVAFVLSDPRQRLVFGRVINPAFAIAEVLWILAGANDAGFLTFWNPRMSRYTDPIWQDRLHGAYGFRLASQPELSTTTKAQLRHTAPRDRSRTNQLYAAYEALRYDPSSRQIVLQYWDSQLDLPNPISRSNDIPCNLISHLLVRDGRLEWLQVLRSNDLFWGLPYNIIQFTTLQEIMAGWLGLELGSYTQISDSLHVYERHWPELDAFEADTQSIPHNAADLRIVSLPEWEQILSYIVDGAVELTQFDSVDDLVAVAARSRDLPPAYADWITVLTAEALRRRGHVIEADKVIARAGEFWATSWRLWAARREGLRARPLPNRFE